MQSSPHHRDSQIHGMKQIAHRFISRLPAASEGHEDVVELLLEAKAKVDSKDGWYRCTPLSWADEKGHAEVVKLLPEAKAVVDPKSNNGRQSNNNLP